MTIRQLNEPCWALDPNPYDDETATRTTRRGPTRTRRSRSCARNAPALDDLAVLESVKVQALRPVLGSRVRRAQLRRTVHRRGLRRQPLHHR